MYIIWFYVFIFLFADWRQKGKSKSINLKKQYLEAIVLIDWIKMITMNKHLCLLIFFFFDQVYPTRGQNQCYRRAGYWASLWYLLPLCYNFKSTNFSHIRSKASLIVRILRSGSGYVLQKSVNGLWLVNVNVGCV